MFYRRFYRGIQRLGAVLVVALVLAGVLLPATASAAPAAAPMAAAGVRPVVHRPARRQPDPHCPTVRNNGAVPGRSKRHLEPQPHLCGAGAAHLVSSSTLKASTQRRKEAKTQRILCVFASLRLCVEYSSALTAAESAATISLKRFNNRRIGGAQTSSHHHRRSAARQSVGGHGLQCADRQAARGGAHAQPHSPGD